VSEQEKRQAILDMEEETSKASDEAATDPQSAADEAVEETAEAHEAADAASDLERQLEEQRKLADEHYQRYMRTQADFDNFRRRSRQEKEDFAKYASGKLKGVDMIYRQLDQVLVQEGLQPIESVGQPFNPEFHQAIMQVESEEHEEGIVLEEMQKGYKLKDKVLRVAMVKVSG
jgi:molecular chaperone GrpE